MRAGIEVWKVLSVCFKHVCSRLLSPTQTFMTCYSRLHFTPPFLKVSSVSFFRTCFILFDEFLGDIFLSWYTNSFHTCWHWKRSGEKAPARWHLSESETVPDSPSQRQRDVPKDCSSSLTDFIDPSFPFYSFLLHLHFPT